MAAQLYSDVVGIPKGDALPINLADLGLILKIMIKNSKVRADMMADPANTLARLNFVVHDGAVKFFTSLKGADFDAAATAFTPSHSDPILGMAEM